MEKLKRYLDEIDESDILSMEAITVNEQDLLAVLNRLVLECRAVVDE